MMKRILFFIGMIIVAGSMSGQILTPVKWKVQLISSDSTTKTVVFTASAEKGWHVYDMNLPEGGPISTSIRVEEIKGAELIGEPYASVEAVTVYDDVFKMELRWYSGSVSFSQKINVLDERLFKLEGELEYMACNDETCLPPEKVSFLFNRTDLKALSDAGASIEDEDSLTKGAQMDSIAIIEVMDRDKEGTSGQDAASRPSSQNVIPQGVLTTNPDRWKPVIDQLRMYGNSVTSSGEVSWLFLFFAGFLGGLVALLTPCVWPMIPMTVSFFLKRSKTKKRAILDAFIYGVSIIVIYLTMGLLITGLLGASALNDLSTNAIFNIFFFLILLLFAISFFGAFEMVLPASWTNKMDSKAESTSGIISIFFMAFTLVLVSFSCTGPIIGTLLVEAASEGTAIGPAIGMFGFSFALAIPFALFAIFPNILQNTPRSGGWLNSVKVVLGFLELALALKFLSVADLAYGWRILDREVFLVLWIVIFLLLGFYLLGKIRFKHDSELAYVSVTRLFLATISFAFAVYLVPGLWGAPLKAVSAFTPPLYTQDFNLYQDEVHASFDDYDQAMAYAERVNKPVLVDFSGFGCVNCRKMEAAVWTDPKVKQLIEEEFILITLMVDDKSKLPAPIEIEEGGKRRKLRTIGDKWSYLQRYKFGANAQPFYVVLDAKGNPLSPSYAFDEDPANYVAFLESGLNVFNQMK